MVHAHARIPAFLCGSLHATMHFPFVTTAHWVFETRGMLRYLTNWGQRTVAVSEDIKAYLMREYGVPEEHITVNSQRDRHQQVFPGGVPGQGDGRAGAGPAETGDLLCEPDG